jgi:hypothetical protein
VPFRSFHSWLRRRGELEGTQEPEWPEIEVPEYLPRTITLDVQTRIIEAVPWPRRGAFLAAASESLRLGEVRALDLDDYLGNGRLRIAKAKQGPRADARVAEHTKNRTARERNLWNPELVRWIEWRLEHATPEARLRGEVALFWCPEARNQAKRWTPDPLEQEWRTACARAGIAYVPFQQGTRHSTLTALGNALPERVLRAYSRHKDGRSLDRYSRPTATPDAIVRALRKRHTDV